MKYHIVGIHKCGTMSLMYYLKRHGHAVIGQGSLFRNPKGPEHHLKLYKDAKVIIILRDPIERMWSHYHYGIQETRPHKDDLGIKAKSFRDALEKFPEIVESSNYYHWLQNWLPFKPTVVHLEQMLQRPDFPKSNWTRKKPEMPLSDRLFAMKKLREIQVKFERLENQI